jgi:hypothetical protein
LTQHELGRALREFRIRPGTVRPFNSKATARGYYLRQFEDAFTRYLSTPEKTSDFSHPPKTDTLNRHIDTSPEKPGENEVFASDTSNECVGLKKSENPSNSGPCADVSTRDPENSTVEKNKGIGEGLSTSLPRGPKGRKVRKDGSAAPVNASPGGEAS